MIRAIMTGSEEFVKDERTTKNLYANLGNQLFSSIPKETPVVIELKEDYRNDTDYYSIGMIREMSCDIKTVLNNNVTVTHFRDIENLRESKKSRWKRFKQMVRGE